VTAIRQALWAPETVDGARRSFLNPDVSNAFDAPSAEPDPDGFVRFLCEERELARERVGLHCAATARQPRR
jgi:hypothetical protein